MLIKYYLFANNQVKDEDMYDQELKDVGLLQFNAREEISIDMSYKVKKTDSSMPESEKRLLEVLAEREIRN